MLNLPLEVLFKIFVLLPKATLIECLRVNAEFNAFLTKHSAYLWANLSFSSHHRALDSFSRYAGQQLSTLVIKNCKDNGIYSVLKRNKSTSLKELDLPSNTLSNPTLLNIVSNLGRKLTLLNISSSNVNDATIDIIVRAARHLTRLDISNCVYITPKAFGDVKVSSLPNLCVLNLAMCKGIDDQSLAKITALCPGLTLLNLEGCDGLSYKTLKLIQKSCPKIVDVKFTGICRSLFTTRYQFLWSYSSCSRGFNRFCRFL
jgi:hypothetical protein